MPANDVLAGPRPGVRPVWVANVHDGPLEGLARYQGELLWFDSEWDEDADDWSRPRRYRLRRLPDDELARVQTAHRDFERMVGTHCCHHPLAEPPTLIPAPDMSFYDLHPVGGGESYEHLPVQVEFTTWQAGQVRATAVRWSSTDFPGWMEVIIGDAAGRAHKIEDKAPVLGMNLGLALDDPLAGELWLDAVVGDEVDALVSVTIAHDVETADGTRTLTVPATNVRLRT